MARSLGPGDTMKANTKFRFCFDPQSHTVSRSGFYKMFILQSQTCTYQGNIAFRFVC